jgi:serine/threonine protein kinase
VKDHNKSPEREPESRAFLPPVTCYWVLAVLEGSSDDPLTKQALDLAADHIEVCPECRSVVDEVCPEASGSEEHQGPSPFELVDGSRRQRNDSFDLLVENILDRLRDVQHQATINPFSPERRRPRPKPIPAAPAEDRADDLAWQLAPGQMLQGSAWRFLIESRIGVGEFTETYEAQQLPIDAAKLHRTARAVVKIPRVAHDMSDEGATERLRILKALTRVLAHNAQNLAGLPIVAQVVDCADYVHRLRDRSADSTFVAYEYIDGLDLSAHMRMKYSDGNLFSGLKTAAEFSRWARTLTTAVLEIHNRLTLHGDICPENVMIDERGQAVFVDVGESLFWEVMNGAQEFSRFFYRAPEGVNTPRSDLFSLGGLFYFLATGKQPIGFNAYDDNEVLKQQVALKIKQANPELYYDDTGIADVIAMCLRKNGRVQDASHLLRDIDIFWPETAPQSILAEVDALTEPASLLDKAGNSLYRSMAHLHVRAVRRVVEDMMKGTFDVSGSPADIRDAAYALLGALGEEDEFVTISLPAFWYPGNIGINGRFLSMCRNAAARGASVKRVFLLDEHLTDKYLQQIVAAQLNATSDLEVSARSRFVVRYLAMSPEQRQQLVAAGRHFGLLVKEGDRIAMSPVYDENDVLVTLRFRSGRNQVEGLREVFESLWDKARPLVDLRLASPNTLFLGGESYENAV